MADEKKVFSIFDFIDEPLDDALKMVDSGQIAFVDKKFDNIKIPKIFNLNNFTYFSELNYYDLETICNQVRKNYRDLFRNYLELILKGFSYFEEHLEEAIKSVNHINVLAERFDGKTLNEIGASKNVTRERVRQIEKNAVEYINLYLNTYLSVLNNEGKFNDTVFFNFDDMFYFIASPEVKKAIIQAIYYYKENEFAVYNSDFSCFVNKNKICNVKKIEKKIKLEKYFNYYDSYSKINNMLIFEDNVLDFSISIYLNYLKNHNYLFRGNLAYIYGECSIYSIISMVVRDYYPKGVTFDSEGIKTFQDFVQKLLNYPFKVNSALSKIDECNDDLILWGKLQRMHINNININEEKRNEILNRFKQMVDSVDYLLFDDVYNELEDILKGTMITDKYKLYGFIKYYLNEDFYFKKMAVRKMELKDQTLSAIIYDYVKANNMCSKDDIITELFVPKSAITSMIRDHNDVIVTGDNYTLIDKLSLDLDLIKGEMSKVLQKEVKTYIHRDVIYNAYVDKVNSLGINDATMLYYVLRYLFNDEYNFNIPYIQNKNYDQTVTIRSIMLDIIKNNHDIININDMIEKVENITGTKGFSLVYNLRVFDINAFRMNKDDITLFEYIEVDDIVKYMMNNRLVDHFKNNQFAYMKDLKELSKGLYYQVKTSKGIKKCQMNAYSLASFIENSIKEFSVFSSATITNYYDASYVVTKLKIKDYTELIYRVIKENFKETTIYKSDCVKKLKEKEIISSIPNGLIQDGYIDIDKDMIILKK